MAQRPLLSGLSGPGGRLLGAALLTALLAGCGSVSTGNAGSGTLGTSTTSRTDVMTFQPGSLPVSYVGESYRVAVGVTGGVGPYGYRLTAGTLPPGLKFSGGVLSGTPTKSGSYTFSIQATDANLSTRVQEYTLNVDALPPLALRPTLPPGEIRGETRIPLTIQAPRTVRAARLSWDLGKDVQVTRVQPADPGSVLFWQQRGSVLTVDLGFRTVPRPDARIALITVKPAGAVTLRADALGYEARDGAGKVLVDKKRPGSEAPKPAGGQASEKQPVKDEQKPADPKAQTDQKSVAPNAADTKVTDPKTTDPKTVTPPDTVEGSPLPSPALPTPTVPPTLPPSLPPVTPPVTPVTPPSGTGGA
ncbi:putative Ig domain-containing protein [Deinococcus wulumuqiensis]